MVIGKFIGWLRGAKDAVPFPEELWQSTLAALPFLARLNDDERLRLRLLAEQFLAQKEFTSAGGLVLTDAMCASIAVQGCLPVLNLGLECYRDWVGVVVYPDEFVIPRSIEDEFGVVHEYDDIASGEAWEGGPLLISWQDAQMAGEGYNVVIHEFAHKLDMLGGTADGIPPLPPDIPRKTWEDTLLTAYDDFCGQVDDVEVRRERTGEDRSDTLPFDPYAAEHPGEFFAVLSETFFEQPTVLREVYPALYALFARFYRQDPAQGSAREPLSFPSPESSSRP